MEDSKLLQKIIDLVPQAIFWKNRDLVYLGCNTHFARLAGVESPAEIVGKTDYELSREEEAEVFRADDRAVMDSGRPRIEKEERHHQRDGKEARLLTSKVPLVNDAGELVGVLGTYADVTTLKQAQEALREHRNELAKINAQMVEELERAVLVQRDMLGDCAPDCDFLEVDIYQRPLERVTGDFFTFRCAGRRVYHFFGADIVGHGISAALYTSLLKMTAHRAPEKASEDPAELMRFFDRELHHRIPPGLLTGAAFSFRLESNGRVVFRHCCAAHPPPLCFRRDAGEWCFLEKAAVAVGLLQEVDRITHRHALHPGDRVFFYTDGFVECPLRDGEELGPARFLELFAGTEDAPLEETRRIVMDRLTGPARGGTIGDDLTLIGFEIHPA